MGWYIAYLIICAINGAVCVVNGFSFNTWQFWFYAFAVILAFTFGREMQRESN